MEKNHRRTKIVATIGPATSSPQALRSLITTGMDVARLNFSHGSHEDHAQRIQTLRAVSDELHTPITILQDLQGPKIRVGELPGGEVKIEREQLVELVPQESFRGEPGTIPIDYSTAAAEAKTGMQVLLADGAFEFQVTGSSGSALVCRVVEGGTLKSRKGVNFPGLSLRLPSLTEKDQNDLRFGLEQGVDCVSLSFVRAAEDVKTLKELIRLSGVETPVIAKIEKPQALEHLEEIVAESNGIMVARGDLGVELSPERVPMVQKLIIECCNRRGKPVITATQMLESMIHEPSPTRAEASDVANAIIDGTDAIMLSGETAVGAHPIRAVEMMVKIAREVETQIQFKSYPPAGNSIPHSLSKAANAMEELMSPCCMVLLTASGHTARLIAAERPSSIVYALTTDSKVYHALNVLWGIRPILISETPTTFDGLVDLAQRTLLERNLVSTNDRLLVIGGVPTNIPKGANFIKVHTINQS